MSGQGNGEGRSDADLYDDTVAELRNTLEHFLSSHDQLSQRAIDLAKIDLLSASVIVTGVSISGINFTLVLIGGFLSFLYSIWACAQVYKPRRFERGFGRNAAISIDKNIKSGVSPEDHYRKVLYSYVESVQEAQRQHEIEKEKFQDALWASVTAILFFAATGVGHAAGGLPFQVDLFALVSIPIVAMWGRYNSSE